MGSCAMFLMAVVAAILHTRALYLEDIATADGSDLSQAKALLQRGTRPKRPDVFRP